MALINLINAHLAFGHVALLDGVHFALETKERVGLIGRNGTGKSSLIKIFANIVHMDDGDLHVKQGLRLSYVAQEPDLNLDSTVFEAVAAGLSELREAIEIYSNHSHEAGSEKELHDLQTRIEAHDGWNWEQRVNVVLTRLQLSATVKISDLSGGGKKRVALAQALVQKPDVLLLDEPTNHLDLEAIGWLETLLNDFSGSIITVTHDRAFWMQ